MKTDNINFFEGIKNIFKLAKSKITKEKILALISIFFILLLNSIIILNTNFSDWKSDRFDEIDDIVLSHEAEIVDIVTSNFSTNEYVKNNSSNLEFKYENVGIKIIQEDSKIFVYGIISEGKTYNEVKYEYKGETIKKIEQKDCTFSNSLGLLIEYLFLIDYFIFVVSICIYYYIKKKKCY